MVLAVGGAGGGVVSAAVKSSTQIRIGRSRKRFVISAPRALWGNDNTGKRTISAEKLESSEIMSIGRNYTNPTYPLKTTQDKVRNHVRFPAVNLTFKQLRRMGRAGIHG